MSRVWRYGETNSLIPEEGRNKVVHACRRHDQSAAGVPSLPFHPVGLDGGEDGFPFTGHGLIGLAGAKQARLACNRIPQIAVKMDVAKFVSQRGAQAVFPARVAGEKTGYFHVGLFSGPEFSQTFYIRRSSGTRPARKWR